MVLDSNITLFGWPLFVPAYAKQLLLAGAIGFIIGLERELRHKPASLRTFSTICVGSCLFSILSFQAVGGIDANPHDVTRIAAQIVTGIGFLGGGVIFKTSDRVEGVTTGALIWLTAAIGMACGFNQMGLVFWTMVVGLWVHAFCLIFYTLIHNIRIRRGEVLARKGEEI